MFTVTNVFLLWKYHDDLCICVVCPQTFNLFAKQDKKLFDVECR